MAQFFNCFSCSKVTPFFEKPEKKCPSCGSTNGEILSKGRFEEGFNAGAIFNIDPKTGKTCEERQMIRSR